MTLLIAGLVGAGSWQIRGVQLGAALGARVTTTPTTADLDWAEAVVLVKHAGPRLAEAVHAAGKPLIWDAVDCWTQPAQNSLREAEARAWLLDLVDLVRPTLTIGATRVMADACGGVYLPHHSRPGVVPTSPRPTVQTVAYEGNLAYLGRWRGWLEAACARRGWAFVLNPPDLAAADLIVAFRDGPFDGWMCRQWKSGVKIANAIAAGRPILTQPSAAWEDLAPTGGALELPEDLDEALDAVTTRGFLDGAFEQHRRLARPHRLDAVADHYRQILEGVLCAA